MCNLYKVSTNHQAIIAFSRALRDLSGNLPPSLDVYPDQPAPIVRMASANLPGFAGVCRPRSRRSSKRHRNAPRLRAKGKEVDFDELLKMEPTGARPTSGTQRAGTGRAGSASRTDAWYPSPALPSQTRPQRLRAAALRTPGLHSARIAHSPSSRACGSPTRRADVAVSCNLSILFTLGICCFVEDC
jgi:hypothetical protein